MDADLQIYAILNYILNTHVSFKKTRKSWTTALWTLPTVLTDFPCLFGRRSTMVTRSSTSRPLTTSSSSIVLVSYPQLTFLFATIILYCFLLMFFHLSTTWYLSLFRILFPAKPIPKVIYISTIQNFISKFLSQKN